MLKITFCFFQQKKREIPLKHADAVLRIAEAKFVQRLVSTTFNLHKLVFIEWL